MKKATAKAIIFVLIMLLLAACSAEAAEEYVPELYLADSTNNAEMLPAIAQAAWPWKALTEQDDAPRTGTVTFEGKEYSGTYEFSSRPRYTGALVHQYVTGEQIRFTLDSESGALRSINFKSPEFIENERALAEGPQLTEDQCRSLADDVAGKYVSLSDYSLVTVSATHIISDKYTFVYCRPVNGLPSGDRLGVEMTCHGNLASITFCTTDEYAAFAGRAKALAKADGRAMAQEALGKMAELNGVSLSSVSCEDGVYAITPQGECVLVLTATAAFRTEGGEEYSCGYNFILK